MKKLIYYVAASLDGYISGPDDDIGGFVSGGSGVDQYLADLKDFDTVIMGKNTYEFGYKFGLKAGQRAYPHMVHYIISTTLKFDRPDEGVNVLPPKLSSIEEIKKGQGKDIYLCGGGQLAGWLLDHDMIDILRIKLNPLILGQGTPLFGNSARKLNLQLADTIRYDHGLQIMTYLLK